MQQTTQDRSICFPHMLIVFAVVLISAGFALCASVPTAHAVTAAEKQAEAEEAFANLTAMQESLDRLSAEYGEAVSAQEKAEKKHAKAEKRITEISEELSEVQGRLNERAREVYRSGGVSFLEMVLGSRSFEEFATSLDMANRVNQSDAEMVETQRSLKAEAEKQEAILADQAKVAAQKSKEAEEAAKQAEATVAEMQATYDSLSAEAAELLEEERKAREAEEAARAAAVLAAAQAAAEAEEAERAAQAAQEDESDEDEGEDAEDGEDEDEFVDEDGDGIEDEATDDESEDSSDDDENSDGDDENGENGEDDENGENDENGEGGDGDGESDDNAEGQGAYEGGSDTVSRAYACLGAPYVWGGVGPGGYDCSGLVSYCLAGSHIRLGTTVTFMNWPRVSDPQPGDIAVNWSHTGVYIGDGQMIHAATYGVGVIIGPVQSGMIIVRYPG